MNAQRQSIEQNIEALNKLIEEKQEEKDDVERDIESFDISNHFDEDDYKESCDGETVEVMGMTMQAIDVLYTMDYIAFRENFSAWLDAKDNDEVSEYRELVEREEELEDEISTLQEELDQLHDEIFELDNQ